MSVDDFFGRLIAALEHAGVPYMVTGSYASSAHGTPLLVMSRPASPGISVVSLPARLEL